MAGLAEDDIGGSPARIWAKRAGLLGLIVLFVGGAWLLVRQFMEAPSAPKRQVARISIVPNTPPPPPPPPKEEKRVEPKEPQKQVEVQQPKPAAEAPAEQQLKMEGQGSDAGLAGVGAGKVTAEYAGQPLGPRIGGSDGGARFAWYKGVIQQVIQRELQKNAALRKGSYRVVVRVWLRPDGSVERSELSDSTGDRDLDQRIRAALTELPPLSERPPEGLPQPVTMRLTSRS